MCGCKNSVVKEQASISNKNNPVITTRNSPVLNNLHDFLGLYLRVYKAHLKKKQ